MLAGISSSLSSDIPHPLLRQEDTPLTAPVNTEMQPAEAVKGERR
jgi:hypothetical protein